MNQFLRQSKKLRRLEEELLLVMGNETCDLDSAISAITLAYFYSLQNNQGPPNATTPPDCMKPAAGATNHPAQNSGIRLAAGPGTTTVYNASKGARPKEPKGGAGAASTSKGGKASGGGPDATADVVPEMLRNIHIRPDRILPVLNVQRENLASKTEVISHLRTHSIEIDSVTCLDEICIRTLGLASFVLVDHHNSPRYAARTHQVIDHRPTDYSALKMFRANCLIRIQPVASCATLIANILLAHSQRLTQPFLDMYRLLYPVIVLDTCNFSETAARATPADVKACAMIEKVWELTHSNRWATDVQEYRRKTFDELLKARSDVSGLSAMKLLYKDMKLVQQNLKRDEPDQPSTSAAAVAAAAKAAAKAASGSGSKSSSTSTTGAAVPMAGLPVTLHEYGVLPHSGRAVQTLAQCSNAEVLIMMTAVFRSGAMRRELAILRIGESTRSQMIVERLKRELLSDEAGLDLREIDPEDREDSLGGTFYKQMATEKSRKQVLPIVQRVLDGLDD